MHETNNELEFWVNPIDAPPYPVDLREFAEGRSLDQLELRHRRAWAGDFIGRPGFAADMALWLHRVQPTVVTATGARSTLRNLLRFLDQQDPAGLIQSCRDLQDHHGVLLYDGPKTAGTTYSRIKLLVSAMRSQQQLPQLFWPARPRDAITQVDEVDEEGLKKLYRALKREGMDIKAMFKEGAELAHRGDDPRGWQSGPGSARWKYRENHAWLIRHLTSERLLSKQEIGRLGGHGLNKANDPTTQKHDGPDYLAPLMTSRAREGIVGKLRWFHPSYQDTIVMLWLFLIGTGWNLSTALALDISSPDAWQEDHLQAPDYKVIHAFKGRADRHQFMLSMAQPEWHPYKIVTFMIERTAALRRTLQHQIDVLREEDALRPSPDTNKRVVRLQSWMASPWLYHNVNKIGDVAAVDGRAAAHLNEVVREVVRRHGLDLEHPSLLELGTSQARDAWIGHAYKASGHNVVMAQLAAQHQDARTLKHYLNRRRYRSHSETVLRQVQNAAFTDIAKGQVLDATRLRLIVQNGQITAEQEKRLLDLRQRTRLGMGCLDPTNPPRQIAPDHTSGKLCRVQRCTGCTHGLIFEESLDPLTRARAELIQIKRTIPLASWTGSSFEDEEASLDAALALFDAERVEKLTKAWLERIQNGDTGVHDVYPSY